VYNTCKILTIFFLNCRNSRREAAKEEARINEMQQIQDTLKDLFIQTEEQAAHIRELTRKVGELGKFK
jgi:predicted nuclease of restriction endonuclease-like (RecB) superfamily